MATDKKTFIAYVDWGDTFNALPDDKAGQLAKFLWDYVNDKNPVTDDILINAVFANIKHTLKRDLKEWESSIKKKSEAGKKGMENRWKAHNETNVFITKDNSVINPITNITVNDNVSVNDNVNEEIKEIVVFNFKRALANLGVKIDVINDWLKVRKNKKATNSKIAFEAIKKKIEESGMPANQCITIAVEKSWSGFDVKWLNGKTFETPKINQQCTERTLKAI